MHYYNMIVLRHFKILILSHVFFWIAHTLASAADLDPWEALQGGDYAGVQEVWLPRAERGEIEAQIFMGHVETMRNMHSEAARWYRLAAIKGSSVAQALLANQYLSGSGVDSDLVRAYALYDLAASKGHQNATRARDLIAGQMSGEQLSQAIDLSASWKRDGLD